MYGLTSDGFVKKPLAVIRQELVDKYKLKFGDTINVQPETPLGQIIDISAERLALLWEQAEAVYLSQNPDSAEGVNSDRVCALVGVTRLPELKSTVTATLTGVALTVIPAGTQFQVGADATNIFQTLAEVEIGIGGTVDADCENLVAGDKACTAGQLDTIKTPITGLTSVTNTADAIVGRETETDAELRARRELSLTQSDAGTLEAIRAKLLELDGVIQTKVFENTEDVEVSGRPPHSIEAVVRGGDDADIATTIWGTKPAGIATFGSDMETITDSQGTLRDVYFSRPDDVPIYIIVNITEKSGSTVLEADVKAAIIAYFAELNMGDDVLPVAGIIPYIINNVSGIQEIEVLADVSEPPATDDPIVIDEVELASIDNDDITVNII